MSWAMKYPSYLLLTQSPLTSFRLTYQEIIFFLFLDPWKKTKKTKKTKNEKKKILAGVKGYENQKEFDAIKINLCSLTNGLVTQGGGGKMCQNGPKREKFILHAIN